MGMPTWGSLVLDDVTKRRHPREVVISPVFDLASRRRGSNCQNLGGFLMKCSWLRDVSPIKLT